NKMITSTFSIRIPEPVKHILRHEYQNVNKGVNTALTLLFMQKREIYAKIKGLAVPQVRIEAKANGLTMASDKSEFIQALPDIAQTVQHLNKFEFFVLKDLLFNSK
ncbi:hypothetical protein RZS08_32310, partial [Arthrospira platensis SPKY1]|nr:hypothetical protein [Arthrospira platensis SPKY1]